MEEKGFCVQSIEEMRVAAVKYYLETYDWTEVILTGEDIFAEFIVASSKES